MLDKQLIKRLMDISGALAGLIVLSPILLLVAIMVRFTMGSPVIFTQIRPGLNKEPFKIMKFRSMKNEVDTSGKSLSDAERLTKFGEIMRRFSLDELPQLINVLKGDMSIVGPRPLLFDFFPYYSEIEMRRHELRPGVTGLAQVNGRNNLNWDERLKMDIEYIDNWSIWLDIKIIFETILVVLKQDGVQTDGHATFLRLDDYRKGKDLNNKTFSEHNPVKELNKNSG